MPQLLSEFLDFANKHYPLPTLKTYTPDEYEMKYVFNTPRRLKKLPAHTEKKNLEYKHLYDGEMSRRNEIFLMIERIARLPEQLTKLFFDTVKNQIQNDIKLRTHAYKLKEEFKKTYNIADERGSDKLYDIAYYINGSVIHEYNEHYEKIYKLKDSERDRIMQRYPHLSKVVLTDFIKNYREMKEYETKASNTMDSETALIFGIRRCSDIIEDMKRVLGNYPDHCETDGHWGKGGVFNGIVGYQEKRASFKSFLAGGWNIQRLHIRYKITLLQSQI